MKIFITNVRCNAQVQFVNNEEPLPDPEQFIGEPYYPRTPSKAPSRLELMLDALGHQPMQIDQFEELDDEQDGFSDDQSDLEPLGLTEESEAL